MDPEAGKIYATPSGLSREFAEALGLVPIPRALMSQAAHVLDGADEATIDLEADTPLARFAAKQRSKRLKHESRGKRRMSAASRRRNRR